MIRKQKRSPFGMYWLSDNTYRLATPIPAVWRNKEYDMPISVIGVMGKKDKIHYLMIESSKTGVPENEIFFK